MTYGKLVKQYLDKVEDLTSLDISPDNKRLLMSTKKDVILWDQESGKEIERINPALSEDINETIFTKDGKQVIITCNDNTAVIWDLQKRNHQAY